MNIFGSTTPAPMSFEDYMAQMDLLSAQQRESSTRMTQNSVVGSQNDAVNNYALAIAKGVEKKAEDAKNDA